MLSCKVLIADDEKDLVELLTFTLQKQGYEVIQAFDGWEAWGKIEREEPILLILDLMMPVLDGWELCGKIRRDARKEIRDLAILMLTARGSTEEKIKGLTLGADDYLSKPFSLVELKIRVEKLIQKKMTCQNLQVQIFDLSQRMQKREVTLKRAIHELKTPLISIGASAKLRMRQSPDPKEKGVWQGIYEKTIRLNQWCEDTLSPPAVSAFQEKEEKKWVNISALTSQLVELLRPSAREKNIEINFYYDFPLPLFFGEERGIESALENMITNAIKYTREGGKVDVSIYFFPKGEGGGMLKISVCDTGIGIPEKDLAKIFETFYRGENALKEKGMGLGLSLAKEVVDRHEGRIEVQSKPLKGSKFSILLPLKGGIHREGGEGSAD